MTQEVTPQEAMMENMRLMNQIVREMKEIPELPSERPADVAALTRVEFPETGGILTWMEGHEHPYRGFPYYEFVDKIDFIKKTSRAFLSGFYHSIKSVNRFWLLTLLPAVWVSKKLVYSGLYVFYRSVERFRIKQIRYCQAVREIHRAFSVEHFEESEQEKELRKQFRDVVCMVLEFDNAYRYRFQDLIVEFRQEALKKNPIKELLRVLDIQSSRETTQEIKDTWALLKMFVRYYLRYDRKLRKVIVSGLLATDPLIAQLTVEDKHYCSKRKDYTFGFQLCQQPSISSIKDSPQLPKPSPSVV